MAAARDGPTDKPGFSLLPEGPKGFEFHLTVRFDLLYGLGAWERRTAYRGLGISAREAI